jgi:hypothetical protein
MRSSTRKTASDKAPFAPLCRPTGSRIYGLVPHTRQFATGVAAFAVQRDGGNPDFSNHNSGAAAMHLIESLICQMAYPHSGRQRRIYAIGISVLGARGAAFSRFALDCHLQAGHDLGSGIRCPQGGDSGPQMPAGLGGAV